MFCGKLLSFVALATCWFEIEAKLEVVIEDCWLENINPEYIGETQAYVYDDSAEQTRVALNATFIKEVPAESTMSLTILGESKGEYVLSTGFDFKMGLCEGFSEPVIIGPFIGALGLTEKDCPIQPGNYGTEGYIVPTDGFPDEVPPNKYKATFDINLKKEIIITAVFLVTVQ